MDGSVLKAVTGRRCEDELDSLQAGQERSRLDSPVQPVSEVTSRCPDLQYETPIGREEDCNLTTEYRKNVKQLMLN